MRVLQYLVRVLAIFSASISNISCGKQEELLLYVFNIFVPLTFMIKRSKSMEVMESNGSNVNQREVMQIK